MVMIVKNFLINFVMISIFALSFVGFKSYELYIYDINKVNVTSSSELEVSKVDKTGNRQLEKMSFSLDNDYVIDYVNNKYSNGERNIQIDICHNVIQNVCRMDELLGTTDYIDLMKYSKLNNELDIIKYQISNFNKKSSITDFVYQIKTAYLANAFVKFLDIPNEIRYINGLDGYIGIRKDTKEAVLFDKGNVYKITFSNNYSEQEITQFLSMVSFS